MTDYFSEYPWPCKCGCGKDNMDADHIRMLNEARHSAGVPFHINSGCRCAKHNAFVGGVENSEHLDGMGSDISISNDRERFLILQALLKVGFTRIGVYKSWIHAGNSSDKPQKVIWTK